ncbi:glutamate formimidoyltransferase [candidate division KSB1 bacterium]|nr:glutamate formimidoyltransferase [candidate division KSB1 bacterium]
MLPRLVECVPNFSEGRDRQVIDAIGKAIEQITGVKLLDIDPGAATHRTVFTFIGTPEAVLEAAFQAIKTAADLIDMQKHQGAHPRIGATDVCPFVPVSGITIAECVALAHQLGQRVGAELKIPVYLYEAAATQPGRVNLADIRQGEYEGLPEKLKNPDWKPDYGPTEFNPRAGATVIGVREFLIAYNVNLNTRDRKLAHEIALNIREGGRAQRDAQGNIRRDTDGNSLKQPGVFKSVKAVGWYIKEYGRAQISINLTNYHLAPPHLVFDECCRQAERLGLRVTGSEVVGLIPLEAMRMAGTYYLEKQGKSAGVPEEELLQVTIQSMGLNDVSHFEPTKKIIEYQVAPPYGQLAQMTLVNFVNETSMDSPAPGGGSVAAAAGAFGAALAAMVANLTICKKGYESVWEILKPIAVQCQDFKADFLRGIDRDTDAFNEVMQAMTLPQKTTAQKAERTSQLQQATQRAIEVPLSVMRAGVELLTQIQPLAASGNKNALSDIGVAALMLRSAVEGANLNVMINLPGITDVDFIHACQRESEKLLSLARIEAKKILDRVQQRLVES